MIQSPVSKGHSAAIAKPWTKYGGPLMLALLLVAALYVGLALTPSHYAAGLRYFNIEAQPLLGRARPIRSDEWIALTPLFQAAVLGKFAVTNVISPYHEPLKSFWALPIFDWSLVFKPQLWGFWLLPPAYAYSAYFAALWGSFISGYAILLRQLGASFWLAVLGALAFYFSHFVQVWWSSNAPTFALAPWPLIAFLLPMRPLWKAPLLFWTGAVWIFGLVYPPFIIPAAFALGVLLVGFRRDALTVQNLAAGVIAVAGLVAVFFIYYGDLIEVMSNTVYPGQRTFSGGDLEIPKLLAHVFPFATTSLFTPLIASNECEVAVVSTLIPMIMLHFVKYRSVVESIRINWWAIGAISLGLGLMLLWMLAPVPAEIGQLLLWTKVHPGRMVWGFGLLLTLSLVVLASKLQFELSRRRFLLCFATLLTAWLVSKAGLSELGPTRQSISRLLARSWFDWIAIVPLGFMALVARCLPAMARKPGPGLFACATLTGLATFGTFNPLQQAHVIFNVPETPLLADLRAQARDNPNGWAVPHGHFGALLNGVGVPAINHVLMAPRLDFFRRAFPDMESAAFNQLFNRYAHIIPHEGAEPHSPQADVVVVPTLPFQKTWADRPDLPR